MRKRDKQTGKYVAKMTPKYFQIIDEMRKAGEPDIKIINKVVEKSNYTISHQTVSYHLRRIKQDEVENLHQGSGN